MAKIVQSLTRAEPEYNQQEIEAKSFFLE